jgi:hypothetical protein
VVKYLFLILIFCISLISCNQEEEVVDDQIFYFNQEESLPILFFAKMSIDSSKYTNPNDINIKFEVTNLTDSNQFFHYEMHYSKISIGFIDYYIGNWKSIDRLSSQLYSDYELKKFRKYIDPGDTFRFEMKLLDHFVISSLPKRKYGIVCTEPQFKSDTIYFEIY